VQGRAVTGLAGNPSGRRDEGDLAWSERDPGILVLMCGDAYFILGAAAPWRKFRARSFYN
jgi:hypothetical protein